jgi:hypothetical protein
MRRRIGFAWAVAGIAAFAFLLVLACQPVFAGPAPEGMSAPKAPSTAIESTAADQLLQSRSDWHGLALRSLSVSFALVAVGAACDTRQDAKTDPPHYGPLHRRPPPSFS